MDGFTYILLSVWFAWCQVFVSGKLIHACYIHWCSIVEVVVGMLCVPSLWLLLGCVHIVLIRILYSLFLEERGIYHYLLELTKLTKCKCFVHVFVLRSYFCVSLQVHEHLIAICLCGCAVLRKCNCG